VEARSKLARAEARRFCGAQLLIVESRIARERCGELAGGVTWDGEASRRASGGEEWSPVVMLSVQSARGGKQ
jgi:hypothetical protein